MIWEKIEEQLNKKDWTIYKLTKEANLSQNLLYEVKSGRNKGISFKNMCKIADALEVSLDEFRETDRYGANVLEEQPEKIIIPRSLF